MVVEPIVTVDPIGVVGDVFLYVLVMPFQGAAADVKVADMEFLDPMVLKNRKQIVDRIVGKGIADAKQRKRIFFRQNHRFDLRGQF